MNRSSSKKLNPIHDIPERDDMGDKPYFDSGEIEHEIPDDRPSVVPHQYYAMHDKPPRSMNDSFSFRIH